MDKQALYDRLKGEAHETDWEYLKASHAQGALIWVHPDLDFIEVGVAVVSDDKATIEAWMKNGKIDSFPDRLAISQERLMVLIAAPYVLTQEMKQA